MSVKREQEQKEKHDRKQKAETEAVHQLEDKCKHLKTDISSLLSTSVELYEKCEGNGNVTFVTKANSLRRTVVIVVIVILIQNFSELFVFK